MRAALVIGGLSVAGPFGALAQDVPLRFDVASVKPNNSGELGVRFGLQGSRFSATNAPLREIIRVVYDVPELQLITPDWAADERFDITATAEGTHTREQVFAMAKTLLADRFKAVVKNEMRDLPVYYLVRARPDRLGPRLRKADRDCAALMAAPRGSTRPSGRIQCGSNNTATSMVIGGFSMETIASNFPRYVGRVVYDRTDLSGLWDLDLDFAPATPDPNNSTQSDAPSIFAAVQEQLGLRLEPARAPVSVVVVEKLDRPTPD